MKNRRLVLIFAAVAVVAVIGAYLAFRTTGGGGQERTFNVTVTGGQMSPDTITVKQNDIVTINFTVDRGGEIHLHDYDLKREINSGGSGALHFKADRSGKFEIEIEDTGKLIGHLVVNQ